MQDTGLSSAKDIAPQIAALFSTVSSAEPGATRPATAYVRCIGTIANATTSRRSRTR